MFDDLRAAFRQAVDNFNKEVGRARVGEEVDRHVQGMADELAQAKLRLREIEELIERAREEAGAESETAATCRRRERLARRVPDPATETIAREHAARHEERAALLQRKAEVLEAELVHRKREADEMLTQLKEARARRDVLSASAGRTRARETLSGGEELFAELDRMRDRIADEGHAAAAAEAFAREEASGAGAYEPDYDARLRELKRRMGK